MNNEKMTVVAGRLDGKKKVEYWNSNGVENLDVGDYAIVESTDGFALAHIVAFLETTDELFKLFTPIANEKLKNVISKVVLEIK